MVSPNELNFEGYLLATNNEWETGMATSYVCMILVYVTYLCVGVPVWRWVYVQRPTRVRVRCGTSTAPSWPSRCWTKTGSHVHYPGYDPNLWWVLQMTSEEQAVECVCERLHARERVCVFMEVNVYWEMPYGGWICNVKRCMPLLIQCWCRTVKAHFSCLFNCQDGKRRYQEAVARKKIRLDRWGDEHLYSTIPHFYLILPLQ